MGHRRQPEGRRRRRERRVDQHVSEMAATAREEGFTRLAYLFEAVAAIEKEHESAI